MEEKLGVTLPAPNEKLSEDIEVQLARLVAEGGKQLTAQHEQEAAQKKAQQQQQDPVFQLQQAELQVKQGDMQRKTQKDQSDAQLKQAELQRKTQKDQADATIDMEQLKLAKQELEIDAQKAGAKLAADRKTANTRLDLDLLREAKNKPKE